MYPRGSAPYTRTVIGLLGGLAILGEIGIWSADPATLEPDSHVAFRGVFQSSGGIERLKIAGASEVLAWIDGKLIYDGPARFAEGFPEYQEVPLEVSSGPHVLAVQVRHVGASTRILGNHKPFLWCSFGEGKPIAWKCAKIPGYRPRTARISDILGWIDWVDTRPIWANWQELSFDDANWSTPIAASMPKGELSPSITKPVRMTPLLLKPIAEGKWAEGYGYELDDPAVRFFLDDLDPKVVPPQGIWLRYDLGRTRLGRPKLTIDAPAGTVVEWALSEQLRQGRVGPWMPLSTSRSCNLDHFVMRGGRQELMPMTPKGGRYLEVHIRSTQAKVERAEFLERTYYGEAVGSFESKDPLLNRIWKIGADTVRSCSEDALVDCPTRERGQWTGDVASVATEIAAVAYRDLSLSRRALVQAAQAARPDGLVAGVGPGDPGYLSTYAAQWVNACVRYVELTGDKSLIVDLADAARRNMGAFEAQRTPQGLKDSLGWAFVDWGYVRNAGPSDMALNLHYLRAARAMVQWEAQVGGDPARWKAVAAELEALIGKWLADEVAVGGWKGVGYQRASLALLAGIVPKHQVKACITFIEGHLLSCFPNDPNGPRLSDPGVSEARIMTPYFCHFSFAALLEHGEADFVLGQYRQAWGWALKQGWTTWPEVFDPRWSLCHEWSGCPTWQLTSYVLGLRPRFDLGANTFAFDPRPGKLQALKGSYPLVDGGSLNISWKVEGREMDVTLKATRQVTMIMGARRESFVGERSFRVPRQ